MRLKPLRAPTPTAIVVSKQSIPKVYFSFSHVRMGDVDDDDDDFSNKYKIVTKSVSCEMWLIVFATTFYDYFSVVFVFVVILHLVDARNVCVRGAYFVMNANSECLCWRPSPLSHLHINRNFWNLIVISRVAFRCWTAAVHRRRPNRVRQHHVWPKHRRRSDCTMCPRHRHHRPHRKSKRWHWNGIWAIWKIRCPNWRRWLEHSRPLPAN